MQFNLSVTEDLVRDASETVQESGKVTKGAAPFAMGLSIGVRSSVVTGL